MDRDFNKNASKNKTYGFSVVPEQVEKKILESLSRKFMGHTFLDDVLNERAIKNCEWAKLLKKDTEAKNHLPLRNFEIDIKIKRVIFNDPATIVIFEDGSKSIVKVHNEVYDKEKGLAMALLKKIQGNTGKYYDVFKKWIPKEPEIEEVSLIESMIRATEKLSKMFKVIPEQLELSAEQHLEQVEVQPLIEETETKNWVKVLDEVVENEAAAEKVKIAAIKPAELLDGNDVKP